MFEYGMHDPLQFCFLTFSFSFFPNVIKIYIQMNCLVLLLLDTMSSYIRLMILSRGSRKDILKPPESCWDKKFLGSRLQKVKINTVSWNSASQFPFWPFIRTDTEKSTSYSWQARSLSGLIELEKQRKEFGTPKVDRTWGSQ